MFSAQNFAARLAAREDRWSLLKDFVAEWHTPIQEGDGYSVEDIDAAEQRLSLELPLALREYYLLLGKREDLVAAANFLVSPDELEVRDGLLVFYSGPQGVLEWGIRRRDLKLDDPPAYLNDSGIHETPQKPIRENETLSEFVLQMLVVETAYFSKLGGSVETDAKTLEAFQQTLTPLGLPDWHWPDYPCRSYGAIDILINAMPSTRQSGKQFLLIGANTKDAVQRVAKTITFDYWNTPNLE
jgi:hypothetical protein